MRHWALVEHMWRGEKEARVGGGRSRSGGDREKIEEHGDKEEQERHWGGVSRSEGGEGNEEHPSWGGGAKRSMGGGCHALGGGGGIEEREGSDVRSEARFALVRSKVVVVKK